MDTNKYNCVYSRWLDGKVAAAVYQVRNSADEPLVGYAVFLHQEDWIKEQRWFCDFHEARNHADDHAACLIINYGMKEVIFTEAF